VVETRNPKNGFQVTDHVLEHLVMNFRFLHLERNTDYLVYFSDHTDPTSKPAGQFRTGASLRQPAPQPQPQQKQYHLASHKVLEPSQEWRSSYGDPNAHVRAPVDFRVRATEPVRDQFDFRTPTDIKVDPRSNFRVEAPRVELRGDAPKFDVKLDAPRVDPRANFRVDAPKFDVKVDPKVDVRSSGSNFNFNVDPRASTDSVRFDPTYRVQAPEGKVDLRGSYNSNASPKYIQDYANSLPSAKIQ